jgi:purine-cytosine permease-like protein
MLLVLGLASNIASAGMTLYNASLDIGSWPWFFKIPRWQIAAGLSAVAFGLTYLFVVATNFLNNLEAFVTIMVVVATPWMVIIGIHYLLEKGQYAPDDLHAFAIPGARGRYWYTAGANPRAIIAWLIGVVLGLMFSTTSLLTGVLESSVNGVDLSWLMAALGGGVAYLVLTLGFAPRHATTGVLELAVDQGPSVSVDEVSPLP